MCSPLSTTWIIMSNGTDTEQYGFPFRLWDGAGTVRWSLYGLRGNVRAMCNVQCAMCNVRTTAAAIQQQQYSSSADGTAKDDLRSTQCGLTYQVCKPRLVKSPMTKMRVMWQIFQTWIHLPWSFLPREAFSGVWGKRWKILTRVRSRVESHPHYQRLR